MDLLVFVKFAVGVSICMHVFICNVFLTTQQVPQSPSPPKVDDGFNIRVYACM
jgi:hypothetical protein